MIPGRRNGRVEKKVVWYIVVATKRNMVRMKLRIVVREPRNRTDVLDTKTAITKASRRRSRNIQIYCDRLETLDFGEDVKKLSSACLSVCPT